MSVRITCINKDSGNHENAYVAISELGWINPDTNATGKSTRLVMHDWIKEGGVAYVQDAFGNRANLITAISPKSNKYVKTVADETKTDNLLKLAECK